MMQLYWAAPHPFVHRALADGGNRPALPAGAEPISRAVRKDPEYLADQPRGKVPALRDGDATLAEAAASAPMSPSAIPRRTRARYGRSAAAKYLYWLFFAPGCIEPAMVQVATKIEMKAASAGWAMRSLCSTVLDSALAKGPWILGETFSAADIAIGSGLNFAVRLFKMVPSRPSFDAYIARCMARPAFQRAEQLAAG